GLSSGFIEPLESTSIHLTLSGVARLMKLFPDTGIDQSLVDRYNDVSRIEMEHVRDFIILHYHLNQRDEPLWQQVRNMSLPDDLAHRIQMFRDRAHASQGENELFRLDSWTHCMLGQGVVPRTHHPLARSISDGDLRRLFEGVRKPVDEAVARMPSHQEFLDRYCKAPASAWDQMYARAQQHAKVTRRGPGPARKAGDGGTLAGRPRTPTAGCAGPPAETTAPRGRCARGGSSARPCTARRSCSSRSGRGRRSSSACRRGHPIASRCAT